MSLTAEILKKKNSEEAWVEPMIKSYKTLIIQWQQQNFKSTVKKKNVNAYGMKNIHLIQT